jgi:predicted flavoprotein YhiN
LTDWRFKVRGTKGWSSAQVTAGGIDTSEIDPNTMESKLVRGLFFAGEVMDIDGQCGGYNLQWAWSSGYVAGQNAAL